MMHGLTNLKTWNTLVVTFHVAELLFDYCRCEAIVDIANMLLDRFCTVRNCIADKKTIYRSDVS
jgi:hypothetical protein